MGTDADFERALHPLIWGRPSVCGRSCDCSQGVSSREGAPILGAQAVLLGGENGYSQHSGVVQRSLTRPGAGSMADAREL